MKGDDTEKPSRCEGGYLNGEAHRQDAASIAGLNENVETDRMERGYITRAGTEFNHSKGGKFEQRDRAPNRWT
jgi:hypothetical protein